MEETAQERYRRNNQPYGTIKIWKETVKLLDLIRMHSGESRVQLVDRLTKAELTARNLSGPAAEVIGPLETK